MLIPWIAYIIFHPRFSSSGGDNSATSSSNLANSLPAKVEEIASIFQFLNKESEQEDHSEKNIGSVKAIESAAKSVSLPNKKSGSVLSQKRAPKMPVLGPIPTSGAIPLYGMSHSGGDAIFALACNYPKQFYQRFVGSLRKSKYDGDIVLAVSVPTKMKPGVEGYIKETNVVAYGFDVDCQGIDNCKLRDDFLGYPDPRPFRTFANIRYALYEYWLRHYDDRSYILILDFRDTFFQGNPFQSFGQFETRKPKYELQLFAENYKVGSVRYENFSLSLLSFDNCNAFLLNCTCILCVSR